jgi:DNA mismatch repair protein MutL
MKRAVYGVVWASVKQALGTHNLAPAIDFHADVNLVGKLNQGVSKEQYVDEQFSNSLNRSNLSNWEKLFESEVPASKLFSENRTGKHRVAI